MTIRKSIRAVAIIIRDEQVMLMWRKLRGHEYYVFPGESIHKVIANTSGIYGDLQGLIGNALPKVSYLELPDSVESEESK
jgi:hypothetical protein